MRRAVVLLATTALAVTGLLLVAPTAQAARAAQTANVPTVYVDTTGGYYRTNYAGAPVTPSSGSAAWSAVNGSGSHTIGAFTTTEVVDPLNPLNNFVDSGQGEIRGRGNYTWKTLPLLNTFSAWTQSQGGVTFSSSAVSKRPYQLKLSAGRDVLGMGSGKTWILLANHGDASLIRNKVAQDLAAEYGLPYTPQSRFVDLVVNGEYLGNYLLTEKVHEGGRRVPLKDP
ncbi:MAG TPA: CotH kinase family protein, partial [Phycicoccus elongatus]|nr:CotH kinase family protein [Phycicoccus elongatus]